MDGKEAIIEKILNDAKRKAKEIEASANNFAKEKISNAELWVENFNSVENEKLLKDVNDIIERRKIIANLDLRKLKLKMKQDLISEIFDKVYNKLCSQNKSDYLSFVEKLLVKYAEKGDTIILSKDGVLSSEVVNGLKVVKERQLVVSKELGSFLGGILLVNAKCDKDLTFKSIIDEIKDKKTSEIALKLF